MTPASRRVLLVESLDAAGSDRADARERCAALRALHAVVRVAIVTPSRDGSRPPGSESDAAAAVAECDDGPAGLSRLRAFAREGRFDRILVAAASPGGGPAARALPRDVPAAWWPTGVAPAPGLGARLGIGRGGRLPPLGSDRADADAAPGLEWASVGPRPAGRRRLTLWDGEYLLAPLPLAGAAGSRLLAGFAGLDPSWCALDLVVLSEPQPGFEREARARGIAPRVHFVGRAPREAEWAWWSHAAGAVFAGAGAVSGGFVMRALDAGCPLAVLQSDAPGTAIRSWLARHGCLPPDPARGDADPVGALEHLLERGALVAAAVARGRALAAGHGRERTADRLAAALSGAEVSPRRREAAA